MWPYGFLILAFTSWLTSLIPFPVGSDFLLFFRHLFFFFPFWVPIPRPFFQFPNILLTPCSSPQKPCFAPLLPRSALRMFPLTWITQFRLLPLLQLLLFSAGDFSFECVPSLFSVLLLFLTCHFPPSQTEPKPLLLTPNFLLLSPRDYFISDALVLLLCWLQIVTQC